jgi:hypothetical protein
MAELNLEEHCRNILVKAPTFETPSSSTRGQKEHFRGQPAENTGELQRRAKGENVRGTPQDGASTDSSEESIRE